MPFRLDSESSEDVKLRKEWEQSIAAQLESIRGQLEAYDSPLWDVFQVQLQEIESSALRDMVSGPTETMTLARERVKLARHLLSVPDDLRRERARLEDLILQRKE